jgi:chorismate synthase
MPTLKNTHLQTAQNQPTSQSLQESIFYHYPRQIKNKKSSPSQKNKTYSTDKQRCMDNEKEALGGNITYTQAGVSFFVGQESAKFKVQFFVGSSVVKIPACV